jgi:short-subunit dehydrogenase
LAAEGCNVVLAARRDERLTILAGKIARRHGVQSLAVRTDVSDRDQVFRLAARTEHELGRIDILVNNAGIGMVGRVADLDETDLRRVFAVNVFGAVHAMQAVIPPMRRGGGGIIVNVSSVLGKLAAPQLGQSGASSGYVATKFALHAFSSSARMELGPEGIHVLTVYPGRTRTEFGQHVLGGTADGRIRLPGAVPASRVADRIVRAIQRGEREAYVSSVDRLVVALAATFPSAYEAAMKGLVQLAHRARKRPREP